MFSGKTTKLIELSKTYQNPLIVNYALDTRYNSLLLSTHDRQTVPCIQLMHLSHSKLLDQADEADAIFINEGQFFDDLVPVIKELVDTRGKRVYVCGLDGDFQRRAFGDLLHLVPLCDSLEKLSARCASCDRPAHFSRRLTNESEQVMIGSDEYVPLCRACYLL
jgi:thymidine kinase